MANDIKQRIVLEGEKECSAAIKEAKRNLGVLRSELKAETAELGKNATAQEKNAAKVKNLQKQIAEQEKVVKTYESALKEVKEKYGDNEEAIAKWEVKLNDARTALANMKNSLSDTDTGIKQTTTDMNTGVTAANSLADSFSKLGEIGASVAGSIEGIFTSIIGTISKTVQSVWAELIDVASKSDNYLDLASYFGSTATEVQKWDSAMKSANGSLDTVTSLITKLKYSGKNKEIATWFGISDENYTNDLQYFQVVMQRMVDMREEMVKAGTWDKAMTDIFGNKKGFDVEGVLSDWDVILAGLDRFNADEGGYGLTEDKIKEMAEFSTQVATLKESWEKLKEMATVELFGNLALNITGNLQNIVDAFKEYFQAENDDERAAALQKVKDNIIEIFQHIKEAINEGIKMLGELATELKNSGDPTAQLLGDILGKIVDALEWFANPDNWGAVQKGFEALIGLWAGGKIASALGHMASFGSHLTTIGRFFGLGNTGAAEGSAATASANPQGGAPAVGGLMNNLVTGASVNFLFDQYTKITDNLESMVEGLNLDGLSDAEKRKKIDMFAFGMTEEEYEAIQNKNATGTAGGHSFEVPEEQTHASYGFTESMRAAAETFWDQLRDDGMFSDSEWDEFEKAFENNPEQWDKINQLIDELSDGITFDQYGEDLPADWWTGGSSNSENEDNTGLTSAIVGLPKNVASAVSNIKVIMDGQEVGTLVAPYVSESIARNIYY